MKPLRSTVPEPGKLVTVSAKPPHRPFVSLKSHKVSLLSLLDTGASRSLPRRQKFVDITRACHRPPLLTPALQQLQSLTGDRIQVWGTTQILIEDAGPITVYVVENMTNDLILGIDSIDSGSGIIDIPQKVFNWFNKQWPIQCDSQYALSGFAATCPAVEEHYINKCLQSFPDVFSTSSHSMGYCDLKPLRIETRGPPICQRAYRTPLSKRQLISDLVDEMLQQGVIRPSNSPWASPVT